MSEFGRQGSSDGHVAIHPEGKEYHEASPNECKRKGEFYKSLIFNIILTALFINIFIKVDLYNYRNIVLLLIIPERFCHLIALSSLFDRGAPISRSITLDLIGNLLLIICMYAALIAQFYDIILFVYFGISLLECFICLCILAQMISRNEGA
jgi:hypothetical protein